MGHSLNMKIAISIPDKLFHKVDQYAKSQGFSRSELFAKAIAQYLVVHPSDHITRQLNEIYSSETSELNEILSIMQFSSIKKEDW